MVKVSTENIVVFFFYLLLIYVLYNSWTILTKEPTKDKRSKKRKKRSADYPFDNRTEDPSGVKKVINIISDDESKTETEESVIDIDAISAKTDVIITDS